MPTASFAPPLSDKFADTNEPPFVWPDVEGEVRGTSFSPLHKSAPKAARSDPEFYALLALVDAIRGGRARERKMAMAMLEKRLA